MVHLLGRAPGGICPRLPTSLDLLVPIEHSKLAFPSPLYEDLRDIVTPVRSANKCCNCMWAWRVVVLTYGSSPRNSPPTKCKWLKVSWSEVASCVATTHEWKEISCANLVKRNIPCAMSVVREGGTFLSSCALDVTKTGGREAQGQFQWQPQHLLQAWTKMTVRKLMECVKW